MLLLTSKVFLIHKFVILQVWLNPAQGKGLEVQGTFSRKNRQVVVELTLTNRALQGMTDFDVRLNKNSFGLIPAAPLNVRTPLPPNQSTETTLTLNVSSDTAKQNPLTNLQVCLIEYALIDWLIDCSVHFSIDCLID